MIPTFRRASTRTSQILAPNNFFRRSCGFKRDARWPGSSQSHRVRANSLFLFLRVFVRDVCLSLFLRDSFSFPFSVCFYIFPFLDLCVFLSLSISMSLSYVFLSISISLSLYVSVYFYLFVSVCLFSFPFYISVWFLPFVFLCHVFRLPSLTLSPFLSINAKRLNNLDVDFLINQFSSGIRWLWDHVGHLIHDGAFFNRGFLFLSAETFINLPRFNLLVEKEMFAANRLNFSFHDILCNQRRFLRLKLSVIEKYLVTLWISIFG